MTQTADYEKPASIYVGVGVGTYDYHEQYKLLEKAVPEVKDVSEILAGYGYAIHTFEDPKRSSIVDMLDDLLQPDVLPRGGSLVILWSGHGKPTATGGLNLIARNTKPDSTAWLSSNQLAESAARTGASQILLILDTCFSGGSVIPATTVADAVLRQFPPDAKHVWVGVLASTMDLERAKDGAFGSRLIKLLRNGPDGPELKKRWSSYSVGVRGDDLMDALIKEWDIPDQLPKCAEFGNAWIMLPNPIYQPVSPEQMDPHLRTAARGGEPGEESFYFTGRVAQLNRIVTWMRDGKPGAFAVTGSPGIGKSAILGRIVSLSNHEERTRLLAQEPPLEHADPGEGSIHAHVHALRYTAERLVAAIDEQLVRNGFLPADTSGRRNRTELQGAIQRSGNYPVIVVDGLNESGSEAWRIAEDVLRTLSEVSLVLVGTQDLPPADGPLPLIKALGAKEIINLDENTIRQEAESDLPQYIEKRLSGLATPALDVTKVADIVLEFSREQGAGAFLLARFITTQLRSVPIDTSVPEWEKALVHNIGETLESHIAGMPPLRRGGHELPQAARELLEALAWAKGPGLPDDIWPIVATALSSTGTSYERADVFWLLPQVERYIIEDGQGGRAVYRLLHQWLTDHFQPTSRAFRESGTADDRAVKVARALVDYYQRLLTAGQLPQMPGYLWRYTWRHCADAGEVGIDAFRRLVEQDHQAFAAQLALALSALSKRQAGLGRWQEASRAALETVTIYRKLADSDPTLRTDLIEALVMLGRIQALAGQWQEALQAAKEAMELVRNLDTTNPTVGLLFAQALTALSAVYGQTGQLRETVEPASEAVSLLRRLSSDNPAFDPDLADTLVILGSGYALTGQPQAAVTAAEEAVALVRTLDTTNPATRFSFAWGLGILSLGYVQTGQPQAAVAAATEAVDLFKALDTANPTVDFLLAWALCTLGTGYLQTGQPQQAVEVATQAVAIFRRLDTANPTVDFLLAWALYTLGTGYLQTGQPQQAVEVATQAVAISRRLDTANPTVALLLAGALTALGSGYVLMGQPQQAVTAAEEAVALVGTLDTTNPAIGFQLAWALGTLGAGYTLTGQPQQAVEATTEAVEIFRTLDTANPAVGFQFARALTTLGLGYVQTGQPQQAVEATTAAVEISRTLDTANPAVGFLLAWALGTLGLGYVQTGQPQEAVKTATESVALFKTLDTTNPTVGLLLAWALATLGLGYALMGQPQAAVTATEEAVRLLQGISGLNPTLLLLALTDALGKLGDYYHEAGRNTEIDAQWERAINSRQCSGDKAFLLLRRAEGREPGNAAAVDDLIRAKSYLTAADRERLADLHEVCRSRRSANPIDFDAAWRQQSGEAPPQWLTIDPSYLTVVWEWITKEPLESARDFLSQHIDGLPPELAAVALDEIAAFLIDPSAIERFRDLLERAHKVGVDEAYRPQFAMRLLDSWMSSDVATTRTMLRERREELLGNDVDEALRSLLADKPEDPQLVTHRALLNLTRSGREDLAFQAIEDPTRSSALLLDLARAGDVDALDAMATILFAVRETDSERALPCFYQAIALALGNQPDKASAAVVKARRLDPTQVSAWLALLFELAAKHSNELSPLSQALIAPLPPEAAGS